MCSSSNITLIDVLKSIAPNRLNNKDINLDTNLISLGLDSIEFIKLINQIEKEFNITIDEDMINIGNLNTLYDLENMIKSL